MANLQHVSYVAWAASNLDSRLGRGQIVLWRGRKQSSRLIREQDREIRHITEMIRHLIHEQLKSPDVKLNLTSPISDNEFDTAIKVLKSDKAAGPRIIFP